MTKVQNIIDSHKNFKKKAIYLPSSKNRSVQFQVKGKPNFQPNFIDKTTSVAEDICIKCSSKGDICRNHYTLIILHPLLQISNNFDYFYAKIFLQ